MVASYQVLESSFLSNASHLDLEIEASKFSNKFSNNLSPLFLSQTLSIKTSFREKIAHSKSAKEIASFFIVEHASLATTYPDVCAAYMIYTTVPVTVATAGRSFFKLKLTKKLFSKFHAQKRLNGLALLSIENERAKNLDFGEVIQQFAGAKARRKNFKFPITRK